MNPQVFGKEHLIYIAISLLTAFAVIFLAGRYAKSERTRTVFLKCAAGVLFLLIFSFSIMSVHCLFIHSFIIYLDL